MNWEFLKHGAYDYFLDCLKEGPVQRVITIDKSDVELFNSQRVDNSTNAQLKQVFHSFILKVFFFDKKKLQDNCL